jgi:PAS domain S-box-containing protein
MEAIAGARKDDVLGAPVFDRFPAWRGEQALVARALAGEIAVSPRFPAATERRFEATYKPLSPGVMVVIRDMTPADTVREQLHETDARFQIMADTSPVLLWMAGTDGLCNFFNQRWLDFTGRTMEMEVGNGWAEGVHAEDFQDCMDRYLAAFVARKPFRMEYRLRRADGRYRWLLDTGVPRYTPAGAFAGFIGSCIDITDSKLARDELDRRVRERTAELEAFTYSVSHDLRAPLRGIDGFSHALLEDYGHQLDDTGRDYLRRVRDSTQRMSSLIDDLLQLSRVGRLELSVGRCDLSQLAHASMAALHEREPARTADVRIQPGLVVHADPRLLQIALDNLLGNAWKFTSKTQTPVIELTAEERDGETVYVVRDNGAGFDMAYAEKLFGAFQRLHSSDDFPGTGIGLATVKRIIGRLGGRIWAHSAVGQGASFFVTLPAPADH